MREDSLSSHQSTREKAIFNLKNIYLRIGDEMESITSGLDLSKLNSAGEKSSAELMLLAFVSIFQYAEGMSDSDASEALRTRVDWKYALGLPFGLPSIDPEELCDFRRHLWTHPESSRTFEALVERVAAYGLFGARPVVKEINCALLNLTCYLSRIAQVEDAFARALGALAAHNPDWLKGNILPHWYARYSTPNRNIMLISPADKEKYASDLGVDAHRLLEKVRVSGLPDLPTLQEIRDLEKALDRHYRAEGDELYWRTTCKDGEEYAIKILNCRSLEANQ